jgi:syntaxin 16
LDDSFFTEIKSREEKSTVLFEFEDQTEEDPLAKHLDQIWAKDDLAYLEENTRYVKHREKEINQIVQSISDLNTIFKELGSLVTEQVGKLVHPQIILKGIQ